MNLLSLMHQEYRITVEEFTDGPTYYQLILNCQKVNDVDNYVKTKIELETLRDNAKRLYEACNNALPEGERT